MIPTRQPSGLCVWDFAEIPRRLREDARFLSLHSTNLKARIFLENLVSVQAEESFSDVVPGWVCMISYRSWFKSGYKALPMSSSKSTERPPGWIAENLERS